MADIKVGNIVASTIFAKKLDLDYISKSLEGVEYEPEQFPGLVCRLDEPKTATLLFSSGKANCTGARSIEDVRRAVSIIAERLRRINIDVYRNFSIVAYVVVLFWLLQVGW